MAYIAGLVIVGLFFLALHYFTELTRTQKAAITAVLVAIVAFAIGYNTYSDAQRENMLRAVTKYNQGKTVVCEGVEVNNKNYSISIGTYTFIGKEGTEHGGRMISASTCE